MKKNNLCSKGKIGKSIVALSMITAMAVPNIGISTGTVAQASETGEVVIPKPIKEIDFNEGLQELMETDEKFSITKSEELYFQKTAEEVGVSERVDANGLVYVGTGDTARYYKGIISNQPTTMYDEEKGTVLKIGKTHVIPEITKSQSAGLEDAAATAALDAAIPIVTDGSVIQEEYTVNSEIVVSNPFGSEELADELEEYDRYYEPNREDKTLVKYGDKYQPLWTKGVTISYWIKVPTDVEGHYLPSSALRWELLGQNYYQAEDYAKYLSSSNWFVERKNWTQEWYDIAAKEESKTVYGSMYYFKYLETQKDDAGNNVLDASGAPIALEYVGTNGQAGPVYDSRFMVPDEAETNDITWSKYFEFNPNYKQGYYRLSDGTYELIYESAHYAKYNSLWMPEDELRKKFNIHPLESLYETVEEDGIIKRVGKVYVDEEGHRYSITSQTRRAMVDGELQIDVDNSIFWVPDNNLGINQNPNHRASYGSKGGMNNGDVFFMNSWQESEKLNPVNSSYGGTYQSALSPALSPVTSVDEDGYGVHNGNADKWHQVTITMQNDWVEFYVDGVCVDVNNTYSSRGQLALDYKKSFKRLNYGTGLRYGWGSEKGIGNLKYGNYVCRLLMDWLTDEDSTLHIGGAGQYAKEYNQAFTSNEFYIDDMKFYGELLSEEQIVAAYEKEAAPMTAEADVIGSFVDMSVTDVSVDVDNAVAVKKDSVEDKQMDVIEVAANEKSSTRSAAQLKNPFAGKDLDGATISYWVKQEDANKTATLFFLDGMKAISQPKLGDLGIASSILYIQNDGTASFNEGYSNAEVYSKLKNIYTTATDTNQAEGLLADTVNNWSYVTVTMTNGSIKYYVDGELVENVTAYPAGVRFLDGYYQRVADENNIMTRYGAYGSTSNQCATTIMDFLTAKDTALYLGAYQNAEGMGNVKTSTCSFAGIKTIDKALIGEEVKELYVNRFAESSEAEKVPESSETNLTLGDVNMDGQVNLHDAQLTLRGAALLVRLTGTQTKVADVDRSGEVDLEDAQLVLKSALLLIDEFPDRSPQISDAPVESEEPTTSETILTSEEPDIPEAPVMSYAPVIRTMSPEGPKLPTVAAVDYEVAGVEAVMLATNGAIEDDGILTFTAQNRQSAKGIEYQWPFSGRTDLVETFEQAGVTDEMILKVDEDGFSTKGNYLGVLNGDDEEARNKLLNYEFPRPKWNTGISLSFWSKQKWQYSTQSNADRILVIKSSKYCDQYADGGYEGFGSPLNSHGQGCDFALVLYSNGTIILESGDESTNGMRTQNYIAGKDDEWTHYTVTIANDWITVYINGQEMVYQNVDFYKDAASACFNDGFMTRYNATGIITQEMIDNDLRGYYTVQGITKNGPWILPASKEDVPENYETNFETTLIGNGIYSNPGAVRGYKLLMELLTQENVEVYLGGVESCCVNSQSYGEYEYKTPDGSQVAGLTFFDSELKAGEVASLYEGSVARLGVKLGIQK